MKPFLEVFDTDLNYDINMYNMKINFRSNEDNYISFRRSYPE
jgi:hypothetical protein